MTASIERKDAIKTHMCPLKALFFRGQVKWAVEQWLGCEGDRVSAMTSPTAEDRKEQWRQWDVERGGGKKQLAWKLHHHLSSENHLNT